MARELVQKKATGTEDFELLPNGDADDVVIQNADGTHEYKAVRDIEPKIGALDIVTERTGDDQGWTINGELSVGAWDDPRELVAGGGDSTTETMVCLHTTDDVNFTDITNILSTDSGSEIGLFGGVSAGNTIYAGGDFAFSGVKAKINTAGLIEPENVCAEYWTGTAWQDVKFMATDADYPYAQHGWNLSTHDGSQQWRFDFNPYGLFDPWIQNTINGETKYWARFRVVTAITTDPIIEQIKLHTSRWECNANGFTEYFGTARYKKTVLSGVGNLIATDLSPKNQKVSYTSDVELDYKNNKFEKDKEDATSFSFDVNEGIDTSIPIEIALSYYVDGTGTGDAELELQKIPIDDGFVYDGTGVATNSVKKIETIAVDSNKIRKTVIAHMFINEATANGAYVFVIKRDALITNPLDTLDENIVLTHIKVNAYFWKP